VLFKVTGKPAALLTSSTDGQKDGGRLDLDAAGVACPDAPCPQPPRPIAPSAATSGSPSDRNAEGICYLPEWRFIE
jgi:hypothetical protein